MLLVEYSDNGTLRQYLKRQGDDIYVNPTRRGQAGSVSVFLQQIMSGFEAVQARKVRLRIKANKA